MNNNIYRPEILNRGIPDGNAGADQTVKAVQMLADLQPCQAARGGRGGDTQCPILYKVNDELWTVSHITRKP